MSKNTQMFNLYSALKEAGSRGVSKDAAAKLLGVQEISVPVYFFSLKKYFNAELDTIKNGRKVVAYKLVNDVNVPQYRKNVAAAATPVKKIKNKMTVKKIEMNEQEVNMTDDANGVMTIDDRELLDIKDALGLI
jgi:hypothetical protein